jgi:ABC-type branched-subunit amino acid transport system substrate-binding protein
VKFWSRSRTYGTILGVVVAMIAVGLAIPFVFGDPASSLRTSGGTPLALNGATTVPGQSESTTTTSAATGGNTPGGRSGGSTSVGGTGGISGTSPKVSGLTATDRGVTATNINVAFLLSDIGSVSKLGFGVPGFSIEEQKHYINVFLDDANANGGALGRKLTPVFVNYDPTNQASSGTACVTATQDNAVFAAVDSGGGLNEQGQLCLTQEHHTPLIGVGAFGNPKYLYDESQGNLFSVMPAGARSLANTAAMLHTAGALKGKKLGIVDRDFPGALQTVTDGLVNVLKGFGYKIEYRADLSSDDGTATSQVPIEVQQMQAHGVDTVFLLPDFIISSGFAQSADKRAYRPQYLMSDFESMTNDTSVQAMPNGFEGLGVTVNRTGEWRVGMPEPSLDAACRKTWAKATGNDPPRSDNTYGAVGLACGLVNLVTRAARAAGPTLTRPKYVSGLQGLGSIDFPFFGSFSFHAGKQDGADAIRLIKYDGGCKCWLPQGAFQPPRY